MKKHLHTTLIHPGLFLVCLALFAASSLFAAPGDSHWDRQFGLPGTTNRVYSLRFNGSKLYASGYGVAIGGLLSTNTGVDIFDGTNWNGSDWVNIGFAGAAFALVSDGTNLYVGGTFTNAGGVLNTNIARYDGTNWYSLGTGPANGVNNQVYALAFQGDDLYVGGKFGLVGGASAFGIAKWSGGSWSALGAGCRGGVNCIGIL